MRFTVEKSTPKSTERPRSDRWFRNHFVAHWRGSARLSLCSFLYFCDCFPPCLTTETMCYVFLGVNNTTRRVHHFLKLLCAFCMICTRSGLSLALLETTQHFFFVSNSHSTVNIFYARRVKPDRRIMGGREQKYLRFSSSTSTRSRALALAYPTSSFIWPSCCFLFVRYRRSHHFHLTESRVIRLSTTTESLFQLFA